METKGCQMTYKTKMLKCPKCKTKTLKTWESFEDYPCNEGIWYSLLRIWEWQCETCPYWRAKFNLNNGDDFVNIATKNE